VAVDRQRQSGSDIYGSVPIEHGGTGADNAEDARTNLGAAPAGWVTHWKAATKESDIEAAINAVWDYLADRSSTMFRLDVGSGLSLLQGTWNITIHKCNNYAGSLVAIKDNYYGVDIVYRSRYNEEWKPWEWDNPPMVSDVEYRTTERLRGSAVYTKLMPIGACPNNTQKTVSAPGRVFRVQGYCELLNAPDISLPYDTADGTIHCGYDAGHIYVNSSFDASQYTAYVQVWYTKD
jgi:hypothetical protein